MPPIPSLLCRGRLARAGTKPLEAWPVVSVRYFPTTSEELPMPLGCWLDLELSSSRADSHALAATTTALQRTCFSLRVALSTYETAVTLPEPSVTSSRAMAPVIRLRRPVFMAGKIMAWLEEKAEAVRHPRPHCEQ